MRKADLETEFMQDFMCPISKEMVDTAVVAEDGFTYDKLSLEQWFSASLRSPMLGTEIKTKNTVVNRNMSYLMERFEYYNMKKAHLATIKADAKNYSLPRMDNDLKLKLESLLIEYFRLTKTLPELYQELDALIKEYPDAYQLYFEYANILRFGGESEKALDFIKLAEERTPHLSISKYMMARVISSKGKFMAGRDVLDEAQRANSLVDHTLLETRYLSSAYLNTRSKKLALKVISAYISVCPNDMRAQLNQVYTFFALQDVENVLAYSKVFLDKYTYDACVAYYRAKAYAQKNNKDEAFKCFQLVLDKSREPIFLAQCYYDMALMRPVATESSTIEKELIEAHRLYSKINADVSLADVYRTKKDYVEALKWAEIYGNRVDKETDVYYNRLSADINARIGNSDAAVATFIKLIDIDGANSGYYSSRINGIYDGQPEEN